MRVVGTFARYCRRLETRIFTQLKSIILEIDNLFIMIKILIFRKHQRMARKKVIDFQGSYGGGPINMEVNSVKFDDSD